MCFYILVHSYFQYGKQGDALSMSHAFQMACGEHIYLAVSRQPGSDRWLSGGA